MRVRGRGGVGWQGHEEGDEGFARDIGRVVVRDEGDGFAGAAMRGKELVGIMGLGIAFDGYTHRRSIRRLF